jgi:ankyrin repeat protein
MLVEVAELCIIMKEVSWDMTKDGAELTPKQQQELNKKLAAKIQFNDLEEVNKCIADGADVKAHAHDSTLMLACAIGRKFQRKEDNDTRNTILTKLIAAGADVNAKDGNGNPMLGRAIDTGNDEIVTTLISHAADVNAQDRLKNTMLHNAITTKNLKIVTTLINANANVSPQDLEHANTLINEKFPESKEICRILERKINEKAADTSVKPPLTDKEKVFRFDSDLSESNSGSSDSQDTNLQHAHATSTNSVLDMMKRFGGGGKTPRTK